MPVFMVVALGFSLLPQVQHEGQWWQLQWVSPCHYVGDLELSF